MLRLHRRGAWVAALLALSVAVAPSSARPARALDLGADTPGLSRLLAVHQGPTVVRGIATFDAAPTATQVAALAGLGLTVQAMEHVPLALVRGPVAALESAVATGLANDVYPDEQLEYFDTASSDAMGAASLRASGLTGAGITVGIVDSGCDASHPDLADHVAHNVKVVSAEYANIPPDSSNTIAVPIEEGPYQNTDLGSGHGTHVAGIVAADSTTAPDGSRLGVAPDAELVCYAVGEVIFTTAVVTAYDHLLDQPDLWSVDVVNNSWGNSFRQFDPRDPVHVVTRAIADQGVVVVFAAGNSGYSETEMTLNPFSLAPWVTSVSASDVDHVRADFSSNGLVWDNSQPTAVGAGGRSTWTGDRIGVYHPDVTAPGDEISSTCSSAGTIVGPCPPPEYTNATAGGTSMAAPHVAGAAALLLQANPALTPDQVRAALQATAKPVTTATGATAPFWQAGYGRVDLEAAVTLVQGRRWSKDLTKASSTADSRALAADGFRVDRSDFWTWDAPRVAVAGTDSRSLSLPVVLGTTHVKVAISHPSLAAVCCNGMEYTVTVRDAAGQVLGTTTESPTVFGAGTASVLVDLAAFPSVAWGSFTFDVRGELAASDPDTLDSESALGRMVTLQVAQLTRN
jgi:serine protease AprX